MNVTLPRNLSLILILLVSLLLSPAWADNPKVRFETSLGQIDIELFAKEAPLTVENFLRHVDAGFYEGIIFHRVIPGFVIQGGGFNARLEQKTPLARVRNESDNGLKNQRGTLSMARTNDPHSASSQFFINLVNNASLDAQPGRPGYAVFGQVIEGMDKVDAIAQGRTTRVGPHRDVPEQAVIILSAQRLELAKTQEKADPDRDEEKFE
ncbi:peptidyl-prolyl cis-trans isomerase [Nitrincola tapanii]|uniref:Peptidyl-prolyl cis-trans isomerase n=1 Tax=Nitrincola tapanii TaxID=1708751 RepID=A0A5A9W735_9GAMM|nr:peptidylprolyl isomerase [Nitrincola tapanii]KAA0875938.1 peptidyl-prolyl cis-trans isomerase [Nitrincola tapanii]